MALICIIALAVFAVIGIFSAKYRTYAKEAFHCFMNTVTLRKCDTKFDEKIKAEIVGRLLPLSPWAAKAVHGHFALLSSAFAIIAIASTLYSFVVVYNFAVYGNCNGPAGGFCALRDLAQGTVISKPAELLPPKTADGQSFGNANYSLVVYEFGCYSCAFTAKAEPIVQQLYSEYGNKVQFVYKTFPLPDHPYSREAALASWCAYEQGTERYMAYRQALFAEQDAWKSGGNATLAAIAQESGLDMNSFSSCFTSQKYANEIDKLVQEGKDVGIYGTPTFCIGGEHFVGMVSYDELKAAIDRHLGG